MLNKSHARNIHILIFYTIFLRGDKSSFPRYIVTSLIRRQIRDTVAWVFSEPMLHYYIQLFTKSWWPNGQLVSETVLRTDEEKLKTRGEARRQFLNNVPEVLTNLVGAQSAQRGATKVFDSLQNVNLNKQLFYVSCLLVSTVPMYCCKRESHFIRFFVFFTGYI